MKTFRYTDVSGAIAVEYLTDAIGNSENYTVYQIKQTVDGVEQIGLNTAAIQLGFNDKLELTTQQAMIAFAEENSLSLTVYETGEELVPIIYYGGAIGEEEL